MEGSVPQMVIRVNHSGVPLNRNGLKPPIKRENDFDILSQIQDSLVPITNKNISI